MTQWLPCNPVAKLSRRVSLALAVNAFGQPVLKWGVLGLCYLIAHLRLIFLSLFHELGSKKIPQSICGKIPQQAGTPVDILQTAQAVLWHRQSEHFLEAFVPCSRQISSSQ